MHLDSASENTDRDLGFPVVIGIHAKVLKVEKKSSTLRILM
jgi:hypothetical protein